MNPPLRILGLLSSAIALLCCGSNAYGVGATTPFKTYEAEGATLAGGASSVTYAPVSTGQSSPELEASGHAYAQLTGSGQSVTFTNNTGQSITALNVRFCTPNDPVNGTPVISTLDLYVNGTMRQAVTFSTAREWRYQANIGDKNDSSTNKVQSSAKPYPHKFWDETHFFITGAAIAPGSTIMLKKDAANTAAFYRIDCVDVETPPAPLTQPANSLSITTYGAVANNPSVNSTTAINNCFIACQAQGKIAWIPAGTYYMNSGHLEATGITIQGAGMWYSVIYANDNPGNILWPHSCTVQDVSFDSADSGGGLIPKGNNWAINRVWVEHLGAAMWCSGANGTIRDCRIDGAWGDGINFNTGTSSNGTEGGFNMLVDNTFVRGAGDDSIAVCDIIYSQVTNNTTVAPFWGTNMAYYDSQNGYMANNMLSDTVIQHGVNVENFGGGGGMEQSVLVVGNRIDRGGTVKAPWSDSGIPAVNIGDNGKDNFQNVVFANNIINNAVSSGLVVSGGWNTAIANNSINSPGNDGIKVEAGIPGNAVFVNNTVTNVPAGYSANVNNSPSTFTWINGKPASAYNSMNGVQTASCSEGGLYVGWLQNGDYTVYNNIDLTGMSVFQARVASWGSGGTITIRVDSPTGPVLGTVTAPLTSGSQDWDTVNYTLTGSASGTHNVYLVYTTSGVMNIQWFDFQSNLGGTADGLPQNGDIINVICESNGMVLDNGGSTTDGTGIKQSTQTANNPNQQWKVVNAGGGYFNLICQTSGKALDNGGSALAGAVVQQRTPAANNPNQQWTFIWQSGSNGLLKSNLVNRASEMALDNGGSTTNGASIVQQLLTENTSTGDVPQQTWFAKSVPQNGAIYHLLCKSSGKAMDNGGSTTTGTPVNQWDDGLNKVNKEWQMVDAGGGYYDLICQTSGMALDNGGSTTSGAGVIQSSQQGGSMNQKWQPVHVGSGYYNLICQKSGMALDNIGSITNGTQLQQTTPQSGNANQQWVLEFLGTPQTKVAAAAYNSASAGIQTQGCNEGGLNVDFITNGSYTVYNNVNMSGASKFKARVASPGAGGGIQVRLDSPTGTLVGTATVPGTSGWQSWTTVSCSLTPSAGTHNLYLVYTGGGGYLFNLEWFELWQPVVH